MNFFLPHINPLALLLYEARQFRLRKPSVGEVHMQLQSVQLDSIN